jgi:hypothetical protein
MVAMAGWSFLTNHARALVCIAHDPGIRLRDIAAALDITELAEAGYVVKEKAGRRNRYQIQGHLPLRGSIGRERTIAEVLDVLVDASGPSDADPPTDPPDASHIAPAREGPALQRAIVAP